MGENSSSLPRIATPADIAAWIKYHCDEGGGRQRGVTFLVGAGFSASAGIPTASEMVKNTLRKHPLLENVGATPPDQSEYSFLMSKLPPVQRVKIIRSAIKKAEDPHTKHLRINWAHLLLATLVDAVYINQILTTNFDPLVIEALAVTGQPVRAFDLTASVGFEAGALEASSVIYLHGQAHGLWLTNTPQEMNRIKPHLNPVFSDALRDSILVVVGYSGAYDPVFNELIERFPIFRHRLYWVHWGDTDPCKEVMALLTDHIREAYLVKGLDADAFMRELVLEGLKLALPPIVRTPLDSVSLSLQRIMPFPQKPGEPTASDPVKLARDVLAEASKAIMAGKSAVAPGKVVAEIPLTVAIAMAGINKDLNKLKELHRSVEKSNDKKLKAVLGDAWLSLVSEFIERGDISKAVEFLKIADSLSSSEPNWQAVLWGIVLLKQAKAKSGAEADALFQQAYEKNAQALKIKPDMYEALNNWGAALSDQAKTKSGAEADALFQQAYEKFAQALKIKPDNHEALSSWGNVLSQQANTKSGAEADALFQQAFEKFAQALKIKPANHEALSNWGYVLSRQAKTKSGAKADALFKQSYEKFAQALKIKPDNHEALSNWGTALSEQAKAKSGAEADALFQQANEKCAQALKIKPDDHEALTNWGAVLSEQAKTKSGAEADALFQQPYAKYAQALKIKPDNHQALRNWGAALTHQAKTKSGAEADALFQQAYEKNAQALKIKPDMYEALTNWGTALSEQAKAKSGAEADALFQQANEKCAQALKIKPDDATAHFNLGCLAAIQNDVATCCKHLTNWRKYDPNAKKEDLDADADFDRVKNAPEFLQFRASLPD